MAKPPAHIEFVPSYPLDSDVERNLLDYNRRVNAALATVNRNTVSTVSTIQLPGPAAVPLNPFFSVRIADGNKFPTIQDAINDLPVTGGTVFIPAGTYNITGATGSDFLVTKSKVRLIGAGVGNTVLQVGAVSGANNAVVIVPASAVDVEIAHLTIDGGVAGTTMSMAIGANAGHSRLYVHDVLINTVLCNAASIYIANGSYDRFEDIWIVGATGSGNHGFRIVNTSNTNDYHIMSRMTVNGGSGFAFSADNSNRNTWADLIAVGTITTTLEGYNITACNENSFSNIAAFGRGDAGYVEHNITAQPLRNRVTGATFGFNKLVGLSASGTDGVYENITSFANGQGAVANQWDGVRVEANGVRQTFRNIYSYDSQGAPTQEYGISIVAGAADTVIDGARFRGNATGEINDGGTNTRIFSWDDVAGRFRIAPGLYFPYNTAGIYSQNAALAQRQLLKVTSGAYVDELALFSPGGGFEFVDSTAASTVLKIPDTARLTAPTATDTLVGKATTDTLTNKTLTSPAINGTPTGTGISTVTLKKGSGAGAYTSSSASYVDVDATNLAYTVTIPSGWKLSVIAHCVVFQSTAVAGMYAAIYDGAVLQEVFVNPQAVNESVQIGLGWVIAGDGNPHTVKLQFKTANAADAVNIRNQSATDLPTMVFTLTPSN